MTKELINPMILHDTRDLMPMDISTSNDDDRLFVVLLVENDSDENSYDIIEGEEKLYEYLKGIVETVDIIKSRILFDNRSFKSSLSIYRYLKTIEKFMNDETFSIDDYIPSGDVGTNEENTGLSPSIF